MRRLSAVVLILLVAFAAPAFAAAQNSDAQAVLAIEVDVQRLLEQGFDDLPAAGPLSQPEMQWLRSAKRLSLIAATPKSISDFHQLEGNPEEMPFEALFTIEFAEGSDREAFLSMVQGGFEPVEDEGENVFRPAEGGPKNVRLKLFGDAQVKIGTLQFLNADVAKIRSSRLQESIEDLPDHAIRAAVDLESASALIEEAVKAATEEVPRGVRPYLDMVPKISTIRLSFDGEDETLLNVAIDGKDEAAATELFGALESLLGMAKMAMAQGAAQLEQSAPQVAAAAGEISKALNAKQSGRTVTLKIPRPANLEEAIKEAHGSVEQAAGETEKINRLKVAALAILNYESSYRSFPFAPPSNDANAQGNLSWRVRVAPFLDSEADWTGIDWSEDYDASENADFADRMPADLGDGSTTHSDIVWVTPKKAVRGFADITDGTSNTIMLVLTERPVPWMEPEEVSADDVVEMFEMLTENESLRVACYDGSVHRLPRSLDVEELKKMLDPADGQVIDWPGK